MIDERAIIDRDAKIADDVEIGPWTYIGADVEIGPGTKVEPHVVIKGPTRIGRDNSIFQFASIGEAPQDKKYCNEKTRLEIGDRNIIREYCTINRGTVQDRGLTQIGDDNLFMAYVHIAHDCVIGNQTTFANNASLAGHVEVDDFANLGGFCGIVQFAHLGAHSFCAAGSFVGKDVPPYVMVAGHFAEPYGINVVGLRRREMSPVTINKLRTAYKVIYRRGFSLQEAIIELRKMVDECAEVELLVNFLQTSSRGIVR